jgi:hypothetical protein
MIHSTTTATNTTAIKLKKNMMIKFKVYITKIIYLLKTFYVITLKVILLLDESNIAFYITKKTYK